MKVGIDISSIVYGTGVSLYTSNLVRSLAKYHPENKYTLLGGSLRGRKKLREFIRSTPKDVVGKILPLPPKIQSYIFNQLHFPISTFTGDLDVFHSWDWYTPKTNKSALVTTIHDLTAIKYPSQTHPEIVKKHRVALAWIKKEAAAIIAVSESTKKDIVDLLGIKSERVHVIHEALPDESKISVSKAKIPKVLDSYQITKPYFISIASQEPRKNLNRVIQAFKSFEKDFQLVLVGKSGYESVKDAPGVIKTGYVPFTDLAALLRGSQALVYASTYEGFGLPILDAFYHSTPVVTSNVSSMPEVVGSAGVLVDPLSVSSIASGMKKALEDRKSLVNKGKKRLDKFSWMSVAKKTNHVYKIANAQ